MFIGDFVFTITVGLEHSEVFNFLPRAVLAKTEQRLLMPNWTTPTNLTCRIKYWESKDLALMNDKFILKNGLILLNYTSINQYNINLTIVGLLIPDLPKELGHPSTALLVSSK